MKNSNLILKNNEFEANIFSARILRISCIFLIVTQILNYLRIFTINQSIMTFTTIFGILIILIPTILINILKLEKEYIKYIVITCSVLVVGLLNMC